MIFPHPIIASALLPTHNVEFDTKLLLGPQLVRFNISDGCEKLNDKKKDNCNI